MGTVRCPLYTLSNGLGFPAFLQHQYIGTSRVQLLQAIEQRGLLTAQEIQTALAVRSVDNKFVCVCYFKTYSTFLFTVKKTWKFMGICIGHLMGKLFLFIYNELYG